MDESGGNHLDMKVGYACNNDCIHCVIRDYQAALHAAKKEEDCTTAECLDLIRNAAARGVKTITLTGGEPTLRADFFELLKACRAAGLRAGVQTNGRQFRSDAFCARLKDCGAPVFVVALHGPTADIHDTISRRPGSFAQTSQGIRNLRSAGYSVVGKLVISCHNAAVLVETMELMASLGVRDACFAFPHGHGSARVNYRQIVPRFSAIRQEIDRLTARAGEIGFGLELEAFPLCVLHDPAYVSEFRFLAPGKRLCVPSHSEEFDWDVLRGQDKRKFAQCRECSFDRYCEGPWKEYPAAFGEEEFRAQPSEALLALLAFSLKQGAAGAGGSPCAS